MNVARIIRSLTTVPVDHDTQNSIDALRLATDKEKIHIGVLARNERETLGDKFHQAQQKAKGKGSGTVESLLKQFA
jgi:uncharacterized membrane protein